MKQASPPHTYTVGIAAPAGDDLLVQMIAEGLRTHGMCRVVSLIQDSGTPPTLAQRILLAGDRALSRWLPGSSLPCPDPEASISPPETATPSSTLDGVIVVGALAVETDGLAPGASTYRLELGDQREDFPPIPGATEVLCRCGTVRMRLRHLSGERASFRGGEMAVQTHRYSIHRTRSTVLASLPTFLENALLPSDPSLCQTSASEEERAAGPPERIGWRAMARHLGGLVSALIERLLFRFQWILAVAPAPTPGQPVNWSLLRPVPQPADRLWADPFLVRRDGRLWLFFEDAPFQSRKGIDIGHISVAPIEPGGLLGPVRSALDMETHLSYPNVFEFNGEWYM